MLTDYNNEGNTFTFPAHLPSPYNDLLDKHTLGTGASWNSPLFANISGYSFPQRMIQLPIDWLAYLNPILMQSDGTNSTAINSYVSLLPPGPKEFGVAKILSIVLNTALSTIGQNLTWQGIMYGIHPQEQRMLTLSRSSCWAY